MRCAVFLADAMVGIHHLRSSTISGSLDSFNSYPLNPMSDRVREEKPTVCSVGFWNALLDFLKETTQIMEDAQKEMREKYPILRKGGDVDTNE